MPSDLPAIGDNGGAVHQYWHQILTGKFELGLIGKSNEFDACVQFLMRQSHTDPPTEGAKPPSVHARKIIKGYRHAACSRIGDQHHSGDCLERIVIEYGQGLSTRDCVNLLYNEKIDQCQWLAESLETILLIPDLL